MATRYFYLRSLLTIKIIMKKLRLLFIGLLILSCNKKGTTTDTTKDTNAIEVTYQESTVDFVNPERGFYRTASTLSSNFNALNKQTLISYRTVQAIPGSKYKVASSLLYRVYILDNFKNKPLSEEFLEKMSNDFETARKAGVKIILRFSYNNTTHAGGCPEGFICPPYGDAPKSIVLQHISQLKPYLQQNADVIACMQAGFIGIWGENYYTDYFGDASSNAQGKLLDNNWQDRNDVLEALLDALPADRMVQVRYPQIKQRYVYGVSASINVDALTEAEAFSGEDKARIGFHNDCFLSGPDDMGTYRDYGNSQSPSVADEQTVNTLRKYGMQDSKYVVAGGETCSDSYSPQNDCDGITEDEFKNFHYSFLNAEYNQDVINDWETAGCLEDIKKRLGYRFVLEDATFPLKVHPGGKLVFNLNLKNVGYASPYNKRPVQLILRNSTTAEIVSLNINTDVRKWYSGEVALKGSLTLPATIPAGTYELLLNLPDKYASIADRPEYAIRFANEGVWEEDTGYNKLLASVTITN